MERIPLIIDSDPGVDDFFAIGIIGANLDKFNLLGITTIGGNNKTEVTTKNALDILKLFKIDTEVASGANRYLLEEFSKPVVFAHGQNGIGDIELAKSNQEVSSLKAWDFINEMANKYENLQLLTIGPLTNIAIALLKYPDLKNRINKITMMGGSNLSGNEGVYGEANIVHDALASKIVFEAGIMIDLITLDITSRCVIDICEVNEMTKGYHSKIMEDFKALIRFRKNEAMHDAVAASYLINPEVITLKRGKIIVESASSLSKGMTIFGDDLNGKSQISKDVKILKYKEVFAEMIKYYGALYE